MKKHPPPLAVVILSLSAFLPLGKVQADSFLDTLLRISGISATPSQQRGGDDALEGEIWIVDLDSETPFQVTDSGSYRSPVFLPNDDALLALQDDHVVRIGLPNGDVERLYQLENTIKLVGFQNTSPDRLLILLRKKDGSPQPALLSQKTGGTEPLRYDKGDPAHRRMLDHIVGWERVYGDKTLYTKQEAQRIPGGRYQVSTDIYMKNQHTDRNISHCDQADCSQPALSHNARRVVFIRTGL